MNTMNLLRNCLLLIGFYVAIAHAQIMSDSIVFLKSFGYGYPISTVYTPDSKQVLISTSDGKIRLYDQMTGALILTYQGTWANPKITRSLSGNLVAISNYSSPKTISIFEMKTGKLIKEINDNRSTVSFSANDSILLASSVYPGTDRLIFIYSDTDTSKYFSLHGNSQISPDGMSALSFALFNTSDSLYWNSFRGPKWSKKYPINYSDIQFISDSLISLVYQYQNGLLLIKTNNGDTLPRIAKAFSISSCFFRSPKQDNRFVFSSRDTMCVWDWAADTLITRLKSTSPNSRLHGFSVDGTQIITENIVSNTFSCWDARTGDSLGIYVPFALPYFSNYCAIPQLSGNGLKVLSAPNSYISAFSRYIPQIWDSKTGSVLATFPQYPSIAMPRISFDGTTILAAPDMDSIILFDAATGKVIRTFNSGFTGISPSTVKSYGMTLDFKSHDSIIVCHLYIDTFPKGSNLHYLQNTIWWNSNSGAMVKEFPDNKIQIISSSDCSKYVTVSPLYRMNSPSYQVLLYNTINDSLIGEDPDNSYFQCISPDLSLVLSHTGYAWNFKDSSAMKYFDTTGGTSCQGAAFSPDNSKLLSVFTNLYGNKWETCLQIKNSKYYFMTKYASNAADVAGHNFSEDGNEVLVNFSSGLPCLYDISKLTDVKIQLARSNHYFKPNFRTLDHRRVCFTIPKNVATPGINAEIQIYSLSGRLLASIPLYKMKPGFQQWYTLPSTLSNGKYVYKFANAGINASGLFTLKP